LVEIAPPRDMRFNSDKRQKRDHPLF
jgi:hypothetical protein